MLKLCFTATPKYAAATTQRRQPPNRRRHWLDKVCVTKTRKREFRRLQKEEYGDKIRIDPNAYDNWFNLIWLEQSSTEENREERAREVYERAISNVPPSDDKEQYWRKYINLWINYAFFEEFDAQNMECTRSVYQMCLNMNPHQNFAFAKIWVFACEFELRQSNLEAAREVLETAILKSPNEKVFRRYIELETEVRDIDRCRKIYEKYLEFSPRSCRAWMKYVEFEKSLMEIERARGVFERGIAQPELDNPESLWTAYIELELENDGRERAQDVFGRFLEWTTKTKGWIDYGADYSLPFYCCYRSLLNRHCHCKLIKSHVSLL